MKVRIVTGAPDIESARIVEIARNAGIEVVQATAPGRDGNPVPVGGPSTYKATAPTPEPGDIWVETAPADGGKAAIMAAGAVLVDHHEPGDPGYGKPPIDAFGASSIGQVYSLLGMPEVVPMDDLYIAAGDHCLAAAYAGEVPGVSPVGLLDRRIAAAAKFDRRPESELRDEIVAALAELRAAPVVEIGGMHVADLRKFAPPAEADPKSDRGGVPSLHHAGPMDGRAYVALVREKTGKLKCVLGGDGLGTPTNGRAAAGFKSWAESQGYTGAYGGDPARGFAGAYVNE